MISDLCHRWFPQQWRNGIWAARNRIRRSLAALSMWLKDPHRREATRSAAVQFGMLIPRLVLFKSLHPRSPIILISQLMHMGDIVACEPIARQLRNEYPNAYIVWCVDHRYRELIKSNPHIDRCLSVTCIREWATWRRLTLWHKVYDLNIDARYCDTCHHKVRKEQSFAPISADTHYNYSSLLEAYAAGAGLPLAVVQPSLYLPERAMSKVAHAQMPLSYVVVHWKGQGPSRDWETEKCRELVRWLCECVSLPIVEIGSHPVCRNCDHPRYRNLCGELSILESAEVIRRARLFIGIDSGPAHLANAVRTPGVLIMGQYRKFKRYMPYSGFYANPHNAKLIWADGPAAMVSVSDVRQAVLKSL